MLVGFCFSFPVKQDTIKSGKLIKWTKGFENEGAVGKDPVELLTAAFKRQVRLHRKGIVIVLVPSSIIAPLC